MEHQQTAMKQLSEQTEKPTNRSSDEEEALTAGSKPSPSEIQNSPHYPFESKTAMSRPGNNLVDSKQKSEVVPSSEETVQATSTHDQHVPVSSKSSPSATTKKATLQLSRKHSASKDSIKVEIPSQSSGTPPKRFPRFHSKQASSVKSLRHRLFRRGDSKSNGQESVSASVSSPLFASSQSLLLANQRGDWTYATPRVKRKLSRRNKRQIRTDQDESRSPSESAASFASPNLPASGFETPPPTVKRESPNGLECCMNLDRKAVEVRRINGVQICSDYPGLSNEQVDILAKKVLRLMIEGVVGEHGMTRYRKYKGHFTGQAGIMDYGGNYLIVTALHNVANAVRKVRGEKIRIKCTNTFAHSLGDLDGQALIFKREGVDLEELESEMFLLEKNITWKAAWDLTYSRVRLPSDKPASLNNLRFHFNSAEHMQEAVYEVVPKDFEYKEGQKIGVVVDCTFLAKEAALEDIFQKQVEEVMDPDGCVTIYVGRITAVGRYFFYHDINTAEGFSGATIFFLEDGEHWGKAIGVHTGHEPLQKHNVGFKINKGPKAPLWYRMGLPQLACWYGVEEKCDEKQAGKPTNHRQRLPQLWCCHGKQVKDSVEHSCTEKQADDGVENAQLGIEESQTESS